MFSFTLDFKIKIVGGDLLEFIVSGGMFHERESPAPRRVSFQEGTGLFPRSTPTVVLTILKAIGSFTLPRKPVAAASASICPNSFTVTGQT